MTPPPGSGYVGYCVLAQDVSHPPSKIDDIRGGGGVCDSITTRLNSMDLLLPVPVFLIAGCVNHTNSFALHLFFATGREEGWGLPQAAAYLLLAIIFLPGLPFSPSLRTHLRDPGWLVPFLGLLGLHLPILILAWLVLLLLLPLVAIAVLVIASMGWSCGVAWPICGGVAGFVVCFPAAALSLGLQPEEIEYWARLVAFVRL